MLRMNWRPLIVAILLLTVVMASAQRKEETMSVQGFAGEANIARLQGRVFVDLEDLARITNSSLTFERGRIILTLPHSDAVEAQAEDERKSGFSRPFTRAAI